ncbi:MAG: DUF1232 domain-containing protein [Chloroflexi bacterium]|nr:DUF1232 domain-containing protein [Chloroflexota bacterium]
MPSSTCLLPSDRACRGKEMLPVKQPSEVREYLSLPWRGKVVVPWRLFRDRRVPLVAKLILPAIALYLMMPVDIIPDFIPVLGYLDDLLVVVLGLGLFLRLCPPGIVLEHIQRWRGETRGRGS